MKYITLDQLKEAGEEVVEKIMKWWVPEEGDLATSVLEPSIECVKGKDDKKIYFVAGNGFTTWEYSNKVVPLLTMQQLIELIEWRTKLCVDYSRCLCSKKVIVEVWNNNTCGKNKHTVKNKDGELLKALWDCACEVLKDVNYD